MTQSYNLNMIPEYGTVPVIVHASQYDDGDRAFVFHLISGDTLYSIPSGSSVLIEGTKPDGHGFSYSNMTTRDDGRKVISFSGNTVTVICGLQMTVVVGEYEAQLRVQTPDGITGTANFIMQVQKGGVNDDTIISDTDLPEILELATEQMEAAAASAEEAAESAEDAARSADTARTAANTATTAANNAIDARDRAEAAAASAETWTAHPPYIGPNGNWYVYNTTSKQFVDSGIDASITIRIADVTMLAPDAAPYVTNTGTNTDPIFHLFIPRGKTVYEYAVEGGYEDTESDFYTDLGLFKTYMNRAITAAHDAEDSAEIAVDSLEEVRTILQLPSFYVDFETGYLLNDNTTHYTFSINQTTGNLEWEVAA